MDDINDILRSDSPAPYDITTMDVTELLGTVMIDTFDMAKRIGDYTAEMIEIQNIRDEIISRSLPEMHGIVGDLFVRYVDAAVKYNKALHDGDESAAMKSGCAEIHNELSILI